MTKFEAAKTIPASEVAERYAGLQIRHNKAVCPFHPDHDPSCTFYSDGTFYCFGCHEHGSSVDFVAKYKKIPIRDAALLICADYGLRHDDDDKAASRPKRKPVDIAAAEKALQRFRVAACNYRELLDKRIDQYKLPEQAEQRGNDLMEYQAMNDIIEWFDQSQKGSLEAFELYWDLVPQWEKAVVDYE